MHEEINPSDIFKLKVYGWIHNDDPDYCVKFDTSDLHNLNHIINDILGKLKYANYEIVYYNTEETEKIWNEFIDGSIDFGHINIDGKKVLNITLQNNYSY